MSQQPEQKWFAAAEIAQSQELSSDDYHLVIKQQPEAAKAFMGKEKDRKPIDPPPVIQLRVSGLVDPMQNYLQNPYLFVFSSLIDHDVERPQAEIRPALFGTLVSSLHRLKDAHNIEGGFFVFGDLSVKMEGIFKIQFTLFEVRGKEVAYIKSITSEPFNVYASKNWPGMAESTFLTRSFSEQGVRLRLRKEPRFRLDRRGPASDNYEPRRYRTHRRQSSQEPPLQQQQQQQQQQPQPQSYQPYYQESQSANSLHQSQSEYLGRNQPYAAAEPPLTPSYQRKRDFSQSSFATPHAAQADDGYVKRAKTDPDYPPQPSYATQLYSDASQAASFASFPQQSPHQQVYGGSYTSSPSSMTPRDQEPYLAPRRTEPQFPSLTPFDSTLSRPLPRSPAASFSFSGPLQPTPQPQYNIQPQPQHFAPQLSQPNPANRSTIHLPMYPMPVESEQVSLPPRSGNILSNEMLPPVFGRGALQGIGIPTSGLTALPSMGDDPPRYARTYPFDFRQRDDHANR